MILSNFPESPKKLEIQQRTSYAQGLLESGVAPKVVATMLSARYECSRSTAYKTVSDASNAIQKSDNSPTAEEQAQAIDPQSVAAQLTHLFNVACAMGDAKQACQLVKSLDSIRRWSAPLQGNSNPFV